MLGDAVLAWLHFVLAFVLVGVLVAEAFILRLPVDGRVARLLVRVDLFYGVSAVLLIFVGIARVIWGAKGWAYYQGEPFFWAKMASFALIAGLSIQPTLTYLRWLRAASANAGFAAPEAEIARVRRYVMVEIHLLALLLLFAVLMARAIVWPRL